MPLHMANHKWAGRQARGRGCCRPLQQAGNASSWLIASSAAFRPPCAPSNAAAEHAPMGWAPRGAAPFFLPQVAAHLPHKVRHVVRAQVPPQHLRLLQHQRHLQGEAALQCGVLRQRRLWVGRLGPLFVLRGMRRE